jgi:inosose dehydratase
VTTENTEDTEPFFFEETNSVASVPSVVRSRLKEEAAMSESITGRGVQRREFMSRALALGALTAAASVAPPSSLWGAVSHRPLDPVNPDILFGTTSSLWGQVRDIEWAIKRISALGLQGIEPYAAQIEKYRGNPLALKKLFDDAGLTMIDVSNGAKGQSTNFIDPNEIPKTIADHVAFARDFLQPFECHLWKCNMGARPAGGPSDDQLKRLANTLNEIGRQTIQWGIRLAPHPHIWGPVEREHEVRRMMELTDPKYVWLTPDTGHLTLGGMDAVQIMSDYFPRIAEVHLKDTYAKYRGNTSTPTQEQHKIASVYHNLGGGGVDFQGVFKLLRDRRYKGWAIFDMDGPRKGDDGFDAIGGNLELAVDDYIAHNINYLRVMLGVKLPPFG